MYWLIWYQSSIKEKSRTFDKSFVKFNQLSAILYWNSIKLERKKKGKKICSGRERRGYGEANECVRKNKVREKKNWYHVIWTENIIKKHFTTKNN